jgi:predicted small integral membrane protein
MAVRLSKIVLVASIGLLALIIVVNNTTDYNTNFQYVHHVLAMDTIFPDSTLTWRAIHTPALQHAAYAAIIATEATIAVLCWVGAARLWQRLTQPGSAFNQAKAIATYGLTLAFLFWFVGFMVIGGEWYAMWQSPDWNGQPPAFRFIGCVGLVLIYLSLADGDLPIP